MIRTRGFDLQDETYKHLHTDLGQIGRDVISVRQIFGVGDCCLWVVLSRARVYADILGYTGFDLEVGRFVVVDEHFGV